LDHPREDATDGSADRTHHVPYAGTTTRVDGTEFGWKVDRYSDGTYFISIVPGDFICYCAPWDGYEYDT